MKKKVIKGQIQRARGRRNTTWERRRRKGEQVSVPEGHIREDLRRREKKLREHKNT